MDQFIGLEKRLYAALIDMFLVASGCFAVVQADSVLLPGGVRKAASPAAIVLGILLLCEASTGRSVGKLVTRMRIVRFGSGKHGNALPTVLQTTIRAATRWLAPLISLASMLSSDMITAGLLVAVAMALVVCEIPACYISLFRRGGTIFDLAAGTRVELASSTP